MTRTDGAANPRMRRKNRNFRRQDSTKLRRADKKSPAEAGL
jgi:hypothetical protein